MKSTLPCLCAGNLRYRRRPLRPRSVCSSRSRHTCQRSGGAYTYDILQRFGILDPLPLEVKSRHRVPCALLFPPLLSANIIHGSPLFSDQPDSYGCHICMVSLVYRTPKMTATIASRMTATPMTASAAIRPALLPFPEEEDVLLLMDFLVEIVFPQRSLQSARVVNRFPLPEHPL